MAWDLESVCGMQKRKTREGKLMKNKGTRKRNSVRYDRHLVHRMFKLTLMLIDRKTSTTNYLGSYICNLSRAYAQAAGACPIGRITNAW